MTELDELTELAQNWFGIAEHELRRGEKVEPRFAIISRSGDRRIVSIVPGLPRDTEMRQNVLRELVEVADGIALLYVSDTWTHDKATGARNGEALTALILTEAGVNRTLYCRYTRRPWTFGNIEVEDNVVSKYEVWPRQPVPVATPPRIEAGPHDRQFWVPPSKQVH